MLCLLRAAECTMLIIIKSKTTVETSFLSPSSLDCLLSQNPSVLILVLHTEPNTELHIYVVLSQS